MGGGDLPVDDEVFIGSLLVTDRTYPGGLLLIHLDVECGVKALQVGACQRPAWDHQPHLPQLHIVHTHTHTSHNQGMKRTHTQQERRV